MNCDNPYFILFLGDCMDEGFFSMDLQDFHMGIGWYHIQSYCRWYQSRIRKEHNLKKAYHSIRASVINFEPKVCKVFFSLKEIVDLSEDEVLLALEVYNRLIIKEFVSLSENMCELEEYFESDQIENHLQMSYKNNYCNLVSCLLLAKKYYRGSTVLCKDLVDSLLQISGYELSVAEVCENETKILKVLDYKINFPLLHSYCHILFEVVGGVELGITRKRCYETCYEILKLYYLNINSFMTKMSCKYLLDMELISAGILCTMIYQCSSNDCRTIPNEICSKLEKETGKNKYDFLEITYILIKLINMLSETKDQDWHFQSIVINI